MVFDKEYFIRRLLYFLFGYKPQRLAGILLGFIGVLLDYPKENLWQQFPIPETLGFHL